MFPIEFKELVKRETPVSTLHSFSGGSLDGQTKQATEHFVLTDKVIITINDEMYQYVSDGEFKFIGKTHKKTFAKPTAKQRFINWLLS